MVKLPPPIWTVLFVLAGAAVSWLAGWPQIPWLHRPPLGIALVVLGFVPPLWAFGLFRREGTELNPTSATNSKLVTAGPFRFTRNPMYLGLVVISLGIAVWVGAWPMFLAPLASFATSNWVHIPFEEAKMRRQFGDAFDGYVGRVRRWI